MARTFLLLLGLLFLSITLHTSVEAAHFVLVHGLGHGAWCWYKITTLLQRAGHQATAIDLTSNGISKAVADNVTSVAQYTQPLTQILASVQAPNKVILVGHSLGGSSITYAMELFSEKIDKAIFLAAFMPISNQTFLPLELLQASSPFIQQGVVILNFGNGPSMPLTSFYINLTSARDFFYNESPREDVNLAKSLLNPSPGNLVTHTFMLTPTKYGSIRRYYIKTDRDRILLPSLQNSYIQQNPPYKVLFIPRSDHSAFFSKPVILSGLLLSIAAQ